jgi:hypothetical protein
MPWKYQTLQLFQEKMKQLIKIHAVGGALQSTAGNTRQ